MSISVPWRLTSLLSALDIPRRHSVPETSFNICHPLPSTDFIWHHLASLDITRCPLYPSFSLAVPQRPSPWLRVPHHHSATLGDLRRPLVSLGVPHHPLMCLSILCCPSMSLDAPQRSSNNIVSLNLSKLVMLPPMSLDTSSNQLSHFHSCFLYIMLYMFLPLTFY